MSSSNLLRLGGLAATLAGVLFIAANLANLVMRLFLGEIFAPILYLESLLALLGQGLLVMGLVGLYVRHSEHSGILGLIGFMLALSGLIWAPSIVGAALLTYIGWALFGVSILLIGAYSPRVGAILVILGAVLSGLLTAALMVGGGASSSVLGVSSVLLMYLGAAVDIIFNAGVAWLGYSLFRGRGKPAKSSKPPSKEATSRQSESAERQRVPLAIRSSSSKHWRR